VPGEAPADALAEDEIPAAFRLTQRYLIMDAAAEFGLDPFEAMARWTPAQAETAIQFTRVRQAIRDRHAERLAALGMGARLR
jgi:hypothetical protein